MPRRLADLLFRALASERQGGLAHAGFRAHLVKAAAARPPGQGRMPDV